LFQHRTAQNLFGIEPQPARVVALRADQIPVDQIEQPGGLIEDAGDLLELAGNGLVGGRGEKARLGIELSAHVRSLSWYLLNDISVLRNYPGRLHRKLKMPKMRGFVIFFNRLQFPDGN